ncbi:MAG: S8 family serine peptidase [Chitinophagaceae bacterium]|nr:S8 family serine peptidase [Chitinophagaceae bacterium]
MRYTDLSLVTRRCLTALLVWFAFTNQMPIAAGQSVSDEIILPVSLTQMNAGTFLRAGLTGKGVKVGIIDAGFYKADSNASLSRFFPPEGLSLSTKDYIYPDGKQLFLSHSDLDWHGTQVWSLIGGIVPGQNRYGLATDAEYFLARTDDGTKEYAGEQEYLRQALAWLRSKGVRLVNISLGYAYGFDNPAENYIPANMNGRTALASTAVEEAISKYNMIIVVAAGNDGDNDWKILSAPADAKDVITVGATDEKKEKKEFSSEGPDFLPYLKPDLSCMNYTGGTSFSAPAITGMVACMLQKDPHLSNARIKEILKRSGHLYPYGNNFEGYGVPDAARILQLMDHPGSRSGRTSRLISKSDTLNISLSDEERALTLFHKKDKWVVLRQDKLDTTGTKRVTIQRPAPCKRSHLVVDDKMQSKYHLETTTETVARTTFVTNKRVVEIIWP